MSTSSEEPRIRRLLDVGRVLMRELEPDALLDRLLETALDLTGAQYAALGILNESRTGLDQFLAIGIDAETRRAIGALPRGRGVLGALIEDPRPLRLSDVRRHPRSYGFPEGHPAMRSFLGVPVLIRGEAWGNLYLTDKRGGDFTEGDEEAAVILAEWAAIAIENARLYQVSERRRQELERAIRGLEATRDVTAAIGSETALERVMELIVKRGRALVDARSLVIMLREGAELVVTASAGHVEDARGVRLPVAGSTSGQVLERGRPERITDVAARLRIAPREFGVLDAHTALLVPMVHRGERLGVLAAFDRSGKGKVFPKDDELLLQTFASSAATAVALAQSVQADRLHSSLAAADAERRHWARELHDETLQGLGALRVLLSSAVRRGDPERMGVAVREAIEQIEGEIGNLRSIIAELRPPTLDELGLRSAIQALVERHRDHSGFEIDCELMPPEPAPGEHRLEPELETAVYRLVQEALTNVARHARADHVRVLLSESDGEMLLEVQDDGVGFPVGAASAGYGLAGMRERVALAGGTLSIDSDGHGTLLRAYLPTRARRAPGAADAPAPSPEQAAS
jgi:signal transduction histidine kinase